MNEEKQDGPGSEVPELCRAVKHGMVELSCERLKGHKGDHWAEYTDERTVRYLGAVHKIHTREEVTWGRGDHIREAVGHLMAARHDTEEATQ